MPFMCGFTNPKYNDKPIIIHFQNILNEYRKTNGLCEIVIDESIMEFTDIRSRELINDYNHNGKVFDKRLNYRVAYENIVAFGIPTRTDNLNYQHFKKIINEKGDTITIESKKLNEIKNDMARGNVSNFNVAEYCIEKWKFSKEHNNVLLNPEIKRFYLSYYYYYDKSRTSYYFCFIGLD